MATKQTKAEVEAELKALKAKFESIPEMVERHASDNGLELCSEGLSGFFKELGVDYTKKVAATATVLISGFELPGSISRWGFDFDDNEAEKFGNALSKAVKEAIAPWNDGQSIYVDVDELAED